MKIIDAYWEKRNLGLACIEITVEEEDDVQNLRQAIMENHAEYMVIKIPECRVELHQELVKQEFYFVESLISLEKQIRLPVLSEKQNRMLPELSYQMDEESGRERVIAQINLGLFNTDRISVDPFFSSKDANNRYVGMLSDELERGGELMEYLWKGQPIGFTCFRKINDDEYYQSLSGIYFDFRGRGLGFLPSFFPIVEMQKRNVKRVITAISTNNMPSLRVHVRDGFVPTSISNIFVKHWS